MHQNWTASHILSEKQKNVNILISYRSGVETVHWNDVSQTGDSALRWIYSRAILMRDAVSKLTSFKLVTSGAQCAHGRIASKPRMMASELSSWCVPYYLVTSRVVHGSHY